MKNGIMLFAVFIVLLALYICLFAKPAKNISQIENHDIDAQYVQLVAVQMHASMDDYKTPDDFKNKIDAAMKEVSNKIDPNIPALVVFPEDVATATALTGMKIVYDDQSTLNEIIPQVIKKNIFAVAPIKAHYKLFGNDISWLRAFYIRKGRQMNKIYVDTFSEMARKYGTYIVAGSTVLDTKYIYNNESNRKGEVYNTSYVFDMDGKIIGKQSKVHPIDLELSAGLDLTPAPLTDIDVIKTPIGNIGIAICYDAFQEDVLDALQQKGANILIQPSANPGQWTFEQQQNWMLGCYKAVVEEKRFRYAINPMLNGAIFDIEFYGQSSILFRDGDAKASFSQLPSSLGMEAIAKTDDTQEILVLTVPNPNK